MTDFETAMQPFTLTYARRPPAGDGPIPIIIRTARKGETPNAYASRRQGHVRATIADAHQADRVLAATESEKAADRAYYKAAQLLKGAATAVPIEGWDEPIFSEDGEFYLDTDNLLDIEEGERPAFVYESQPEGFDYDAVAALEEWLLDNSFEDAVDQLVGFGELVAFWAAWKAKQTLRWWSASRNIRIVDAATFARRVAEAEATVAAGRPNLNPPAEIAFEDENEDEA